MVDFEITKTKKLLETNNEMAHNYYYLIYGRIYNEEKTRMRKFKYVVWFDIFDLQEYFEKDIITEDDIKQYVNDLIDTTNITNIKDYNDKEGLKNFYDFCNDTIRRYNNVCC